MTAQRLSPAMRNMLRSILDGKGPWAHLKGQSQHGGSFQTLAALRQRGLIDAADRPTEAGRAVFSPKHQATSKEATPC
ncbi:hypothetical protein [Acidovorax sp. ACV02]|uniref:hypothetical protein n=1 Tax=Acidovorax sp. ACV02 TaxID=2769310 RepID=UPI001CE07B7E|nr:hypothetical protein [Acidovorax sp. ACV02]